MLYLESPTTNMMLIHWIYQPIIIAIQPWASSAKASTFLEDGSSMLDVTIRLFSFDIKLHLRVARTSYMLMVETKQTSNYLVPCGIYCTDAQRGDPLRSRAIAGCSCVTQHQCNETQHCLFFQVHQTLTSSHDCLAWTRLLHVEQ